MPLREQTGLDHAFQIPYDKFWGFVYCLCQYVDSADRTCADGQLILQVPAFAKHSDAMDSQPETRRYQEKEDQKMGNQRKFERLGKKRCYSLISALQETDPEKQSHKDADGSGFFAGH